MKKIRLRRAIARILFAAQEQGEVGLTVGSIRDRLMNLDTAGGTKFKQVPSGRQLGQIMKATRGFIMKDVQIIYDPEREGGRRLHLWVATSEVDTWMT